MNIVISVVRIKCYSSEGVANRGGVEFKMAIEEMSLARVAFIVAELGSTCSSSQYLGRADNSPMRDS